mmetsp:Transcript_16970/g.40925  ORF Transcript_16970/g.40925 Transcript_16970/m.40925 type:complete len:208 (+) Transcript_16970:1761-2384(+)
MALEKHDVGVPPNRVQNPRLSPRARVPVLLRDLDRDEIPPAIFHCEPDRTLRPLPQPPEQFEPLHGRHETLATRRLLRGGEVATVGIQAADLHPEPEPGCRLSVFVERSDLVRGRGGVHNRSPAHRAFFVEPQSAGKRRHTSEPRTEKVYARSRFQENSVLAKRRREEMVAVRISIHAGRFSTQEVNRRAALSLSVFLGNVRLPFSV